MSGKARTRTANIALSRTSAAVKEIGQAIIGDMDGDKMGLRIAEGSYRTAEENLERALTAIRECHRSAAKDAE